MKFKLFQSNLNKRLASKLPTGGANDTGTDDVQMISPKAPAFFCHFFWVHTHPPRHLTSGGHYLYHLCLHRESVCLGVWIMQLYWKMSRLCPLKRQRASSWRTPPSLPVGKRPSNHISFFFSLAVPAIRGQLMEAPG